MEHIPHQDHTPSGYREHQSVELNSMPAADTSSLDKPPASDRAEIADIAARESSEASAMRAERERKLAEIAARSTAILNREHEIRMRYWPAHFHRTR